MVLLLVVYLQPIVPVESNKESEGICHQYQEVNSIEICMYMCSCVHVWNLLVEYIHIILLIDELLLVCDSEHMHRTYGLLAYDKLGNRVLILNKSLALVYQLSMELKIYLRMHYSFPVFVLSTHISLSVDLVLTHCAVRLVYLLIFQKARELIIARQEFTEVQLKL